MDFGTRLRGLRERAGLSQNALARASGLNPASINRLESGERSPGSREIVEQIAGALGLPPGDRDQLLGSAGHLPDAYARVPPTDATLLAVAGVLGDERLGEAERAEYRAVIEAVSRRWRGEPGAGGAE